MAIRHLVNVECNDSRRPLCRRCWVGWESPYLCRLVRNMFPWLQKSCGGGEPDAEQTKRISSPREKVWLCGWTITDGASTIGVKQRQNADGDSGPFVIYNFPITSLNAWWWGLQCHYQHSIPEFIMRNSFTLIWLLFWGFLSLLQTS